MYFKVFLLACFVACTSSAVLHITLQVLGDRIKGGEDALPDQFPHQVSLQWGWNPDIKDVHFCGGTILTNQWILTAAHCLVFLQKLPAKGKFVVKAGKNDLSRKEPSEQVVGVAKYYIHKRYDKNVQVGPYDIGLIKLKTPLELNKHVAKALLPQKESEVNGEVILSGWGAINADENKSIAPAILQTIVVPVVDRDTCNTAVKDIFVKEGQELKTDLVHKKNICTGPLTGGISACGGDSGGPLVKRNKNGQTVVVGIVSWGMKPCGRIGAPAVFTRVSYYIDWIEKIINTE